jgi:hypothetical protein
MLVYYSEDCVFFLLKGRERERERNVLCFIPIFSVRVGHSIYHYYHYYHYHYYHYYHYHYYPYFQLFVLATLSFMGSVFRVLGTAPSISSYFAGHTHTHTIMYLYTLTPIYPHVSMRINIFLRLFLF